MQHWRRIGQSVRTNPYQISFIFFFRIYFIPIVCPFGVFHWPFNQDFACNPPHVPLSESKVTGRYFFYRLLLLGGSWYTFITFQRLAISTTGTLALAMPSCLQQPQIFEKTSRFCLSENLTRTALQVEVEQVSAVKLAAFEQSSCGTRCPCKQSTSDISHQMSIYPI